MADPSAPTGSLSTARGGGSSVLPWQSFIQAVKDDAPEWRWPRSVGTADKMLHRAQVWSLFSGTVLPIQGYPFWLDPNGNDIGRVGLLAEDLGVQVGPPSQRGEDMREQVSQPGDFDFYSTLLPNALFALAYGHHFFEWVGEIRDGVWRITEVAPLHPSTVTTIKTNRQGWLEWVSQGAGASFADVNGRIMAGAPPRIGVESLIPFVYWPDAQRQWTGRSMLRAIFQNYVVNDVLARVDVTNHEKAGGIPFMATDERYQGTSLDDLAKLAQETRLSDEGGAAVPPGVTPMLLRGGGTDIVGSMKYHDELMARAWHSMVRQLGSSATGSRALGSTFVDLEALARRSIADWVCKTINQWVCARYFLWNWGELTPPVLRFTPPEIEASSVPVESPPAAVSPAGPDPPPVAATGRPSPQPRGGTVAAAASSRHRLPERDLRRQAYPHEVAAAVDYATLDAIYSEAADRLDHLFLNTWMPEMLSAIGDGIVYTASGTARKRITALDMAKLTVPVVGVDELADELGDVAVRAAGEAAAELSAQGAAITVDEDAIRLAVADHAKAVAQMTANGVQIAASRKAVQLSASGATPAELANAVTGYVEGLTHQYEKDQLLGAVQQASNAGRFHAFDQVEEVVAYHASELLDGATCPACLDIDGTEYETLADAQADYSAGGFNDCAGMSRCRGTVVAVLADEVEFNSSTIT